MAAALCGKPFTWCRTISSSSSPSSFLTPQQPFSLSLSFSPNRNPDWRTIASCAHPTSLDRNGNGSKNSSLLSNKNKNKNKFRKTFLGFLTFRGHPSSLSPTYPNSTSFTRSGSDSSLSAPSSSSGSGVVACMGSENKANDVDWNHNDRDHLDSHNQPRPSSPSPLPAMPNHHHDKKLLTLPTVLTLGRVAAVPLLVATFYVDGWWGRTATTTIFVAAAVTDWLDGYLARKMRLGTAFGAFLDPVADKLMVAATLILLCSRPLEVGMFGQAPWLMTVPSIAIIGREITMSAVREWAASQNSKLLEAVAVNNLGKWKTATQMAALTVLLANRDSSLGGPAFLVASGVVLLYISAGLSVWSLAVYMSKIWKVLLK